MVLRRLPRFAQSLNRKGGFRFFKEELDIIPQLLQLLRSGALTSLLPGATNSTSSQKFVKITKSESRAALIKQVGSKATRFSQVASPKSGSEWKTVTPAKRAGTTAILTKDKLLEDGWSVPVKASIADLDAAEPGVCLVSTAEARKAITELFSLHPLAILSPVNVDAKGQ